MLKPREDKRCDVPPVCGFLFPDEKEKTAGGISLSSLWFPFHRWPVL
jgi:hypothetical protein